MSGAQERKLVLSENFSAISMEDKMKTVGINQHLQGESVRGKDRNLESSTI